MQYPPDSKVSYRYGCLLSQHLTNEKYADSTARWILLANKYEEAQLFQTPRKRWQMPVGVIQDVLRPSEKSQMSEAYITDQSSSSTLVECSFFPEVSAPASVLSTQSSPRPLCLDHPKYPSCPELSWLPLELAAIMKMSLWRLMKIIVIAIL